MLVLSRKTQEQILIPGLNIRLTVVSVGKNRVQIGIEAPRGVQITRPEAGHRTPGTCGQQTLDVPCAEFAVFSSF
ncbi:MAG: carbon storage regulator [Planctomycetota bacterium]|nr:carbon storage regulator [Planctomycetota bacterium]